MQIQMFKRVFLLTAILFFMCLSHSSRAEKPSQTQTPLISTSQNAKASSADISGLSHETKAVLNWVFKARPDAKKLHQFKTELCPVCQDWDENNPLVLNFKCTRQQGLHVQLGLEDASQCLVGRLVWDTPNSDPSTQDELIAYIKQLSGKSGFKRKGGISWTHPKNKNHLIQLHTKHPITLELMCSQDSYPG